jgi:hypothetical protein
LVDFEEKTMDLAVNNFVGASTRFQVDVLVLGGGGLLLILCGLIAFRAAGLARVLSVLIGLGMAGYGAYLVFKFTGGTYWLPMYAYILPALVLLNVFRSAFANRKERGFSY